MGKDGASLRHMGLGKPFRDGRLFPSPTLLRLRIDRRHRHGALTFGHVVKKGPIPGGTEPLKPCLTESGSRLAVVLAKRGVASDSRWSRDTTSPDPLTTLLQPMAVVIGLCGLSPPGSQPTERTFDVIGRDRLGTWLLFGHNCILSLSRPPRRVACPAFAPASSASAVDQKLRYFVGERG